MPRFKLSMFAVQALELLQNGMDRDAFLKCCQDGGVDTSPAAVLWDALESSGLLLEASATTQPNQLERAFSGWRSQRGMMADRARTLCFQRGIEAIVSEGMRIIDVGAGSGILSLIAARAGASRVYALESTAIHENGTSLAAHNGFADQIDFIQGDAADFQTSELVDLVMGEWAGMWLVEEWRHFDAFARVRDRTLAADGRVLPSAAALHLAPIDDSILYFQRGPGFWERPVYGFDYSLVHIQQLDRTRRIIVQGDRRALLDRYELLSVDCRTADSQSFFNDRHFETNFAYATTCHGFLGWFSLDLAPGITLDTSPDAPDTHWHQSYFPFEQIHIEVGDRLSTDAAVIPDPRTGSPMLKIAVALWREGVVATERQHIYTLDDTQG